MDRNVNSGNEQGIESVGRILDATIKCVSQYGYEQASVTLISKEAGVSRGLLHYHFENKEQLFIAAVDRFAENVFNRFDSVVENFMPSLANVGTLADTLAEQVLNDPFITSFMVELCAAANHNETLRQKYLEYRKVQIQYITDILKKALGPFFEMAPIPHQMIVKMIESVMLGISMQKAFFHDEKEIKEIIDAFAVVLNIVAAQAAQLVNQV